MKMRSAFDPNPDAKYRKVAHLRKQGLSSREIMAELSITRKQLHSWTHLCRMSGLLPPVAKRHTHAYAEWLLRRRGQRLGRMFDIYQALTAEERDWLMREIPAEITLAEFLVALIRDAKEEE